MRERFSRLITSVWFMTLIALSFRTAFCIHQVRLIPSEVLTTVPFQNEVGSVAAALADGHGFCCVFRQPTGPTAWLAPVYPLLVAAIFKIFGIFTLVSFYVTVGLNCVFSALACIPVFHVGKRIGSLATAAFAAWIWAIFPSGIVMPFEWIWDTSLSALLAAVLLWATLRVADSSRVRDFLAYGLLWGFSLLTNPSLGAVLPFFLGWIYFRQPSEIQTWRKRMLLAVAAIFVTCIPWTMRNYVQFHRLIPIRSNFPFEFWSGNNEIFDVHSRELNRITRYEQVHLYAAWGEISFFDEKWREGLNFVRTHPQLYVQLFGRRIIATWLGTETPWRDYWQTDSIFVRLLFLWNGATLMGMIAGLARLHVQRNAYMFPIAVFPLVFPVTFYIAHTTLRHRHPCDPILALLLAIAVVGAPRRRISKQSGLDAAGAADL